MCTWCVLWTFLLPAAAVGRPPATRPADEPVPATASGPAVDPALRAEWNRFYTPDRQRALVDVTDGDRTDVYHSAFDVLLDAAGRLTAEQLRDAPRVRGEDVWAEPAKYRGRLISLDAFHIRLAGAETHRNTITGRRIELHRVDCKTAADPSLPPAQKRNHYLAVWTCEPGGRVARNENLQIRGLFYKKFRYTYEDRFGRKQEAEGLGLLTRFIRPPSPPAQTPGWVTWLPYVLGGVLLVAVAVAVCAALLRRKAA
jgi:hypothetical protein